MDVTYVLAATASLEGWTCIATLGRFRDPRYGAFSIDRQKVESWIRNLSAVTGEPRVAVDFEHAQDDHNATGPAKRAAGWITAVKLDGGQVLAKIDWTDEARQAIQAGHFRYFSPTFIDHYRDERGNDVGPTLLGGALTNRPFLRAGMSAISLMQGDPLSLTWAEALHPRAPKGASGGGRFVAGPHEQEAQKKGRKIKPGGSAPSDPAQVRALQKRLKVKPSGKYDEATRAAVERFQKRHGLQVDGIAGKQARGTLSLLIRGRAKDRASKLDQGNWDSIALDAKDVPNIPGKTNWVEKAGGLPHFIARIAGDLITERGMSTSRAIATAVAVCKRWAAGGGNVKPDTRAKAAAAIAEWEKKKASQMDDYDLDDVILLAQGDDEDDLDDDERKVVLDADDDDEITLAYLGFDKLKSKLKSKGHSEESAGKIAAVIGRRKYGKARFQKAAAKGKPAPKVKASQWDEAKHPRGHGGKFRTVGELAAHLEKVEKRDDSLSTYHSVGGDGSIHVGKNGKYEVEHDRLGREVFDTAHEAARHAMEVAGMEFTKHRHPHDPYNDPNYRARARHLRQSGDSPATMPELLRTLAQKLGLDPDTATEDEILTAAVAEDAPKRLAQGSDAVVLSQGQYEALKAGADAGVKADAELRTLRFDTAFSTALTQGRAAPVQRDMYRAYFDADEDKAVKLMQEAPPMVNVAARGGGDPERGAPSADVDGFAIGDPLEHYTVDEDGLELHERVIKMAQAKGVDYAQALDLVQKGVAA